MTITQAQDALLVVVGGATGNQGGSVIRYLANSPKSYRIRALTRDATKPKAKELASLGAEVYSVNLNPENKAKVVEAYTGADVVFAVTNFWEHMDLQREVDEGKAMIDAALEAGVKLFIFSALPSPKKASGGKYTQVHHFEGKAAIADYGKTRASNSLKFCTVHAGFYNTNMLGQQLIRKGPDGEWSCKLPCNKDCKVPTIDINEYGLWVQAVIENQEVQDDGRPILTCSDLVTMDHMIKTIEKKTGVPISYEQVSPDEFVKSLPKETPKHIVEDFGDNWDFFNEFGFYGGQDMDWVVPYLSRKPTSFDDWVEKTDLSEFTR